MTKFAKRLLSTGDVARLSGFSPSAVLQWIHAGKLRSYSSPGGQHRIDPAEFLECLKAHGMRVPPELEADGVRRVLIVEDEEQVREALRVMLARSGLNLVVEAADSGVAGCMRIPVFRPHLVVLDLVIPLLDGVELCRWLKASPEFGDTKVLLTTGYPDDERFRAAQEAGVDDWMFKPVRVAPFVSKVAALLGIAEPAAALATAGAGVSPTDWEGDGS